MFSSTRNPVIMMSRGALRPLHSAFISSRTVAEKKITNANTNKFFSSAKEAAGDATASAKEAVEVPHPLPSETLSPSSSSLLP